MEKLIKKFSSIKVSLILSFTFTLIFAQFLYYSIVKFIDYFMLNLIVPRPEGITSLGKKIIYVYNEYLPDSNHITNPDLLSILQNIKTLLPIPIFGICIIITCILFYNLKLKEPLRQLHYGIEKIKKNDLDFSIQVNSYNEIGEICHAFENMRSSLSDTFKKLWKAEDDQKYLYYAFAHDLRTPLSIIKGNNEIIHILEAKDIEQIQNCIKFSNAAAERIETYMNDLKELQNIDYKSLSIHSINIKELEIILKNQITILSKQYKKEAILKNDSNGYFLLDDKLVLRVLDNLIENAFRFANKKVEVSIQFFETVLEFGVYDDGRGFDKESFCNATKPFYSSDKANGHTGLGLTIAQNLLNLYNSKLEILNLNPTGTLLKFQVSIPPSFNNI